MCQRRILIIDHACEFSRILYYCECVIEEESTDFNDTTCGICSMFLERGQGSIKGNIRKGNIKVMLMTVVLFIYLKNYISQKLIVINIRLCYTLISKN